LLIFIVYLNQRFSATDEEIKSFVLKCKNINDWTRKNGRASVEDWHRTDPYETSPGN
jgi:hypothetical protein